MHKTAATLPWERDVIFEYSEQRARQIAITIDKHPQFEYGH